MYFLVTIFRRKIEHELQNAKVSAFNANLLIIQPITLISNKQSNIW